MGTDKCTYIIDDDALATFGLKRALKEIGIDTNLVVFENGLDALEGIKEKIVQEKELPTLFFIDLNMPVLDGWDFLDEFSKIQDLKEHSKNIYLMTSSIDSRDEEKAKSYGLGDHYLVKPISTEVLRGILS